MCVYRVEKILTRLVEEVLRDDDVGVSRKVQKVRGSVLGRL